MLYNFASPISLGFGLLENGLLLTGMQTNVNDGTFPSFSHMYSLFFKL